MIEKIKKEELETLNIEKGEFLVIQGCGGDLKEWIDGITGILQEEKVIPEDFKFTNVYNFTNDNLINLAFPINDKKVDISKLAILRLKLREEFGAMWLSDYIDNYLERENKMEDMNYE